MQTFHEWIKIKETSLDNMAGSDACSSNTQSMPQKDETSETGCCACDMPNIIIKKKKVKKVK
jgi:hypothetical protein